MAVIVSAVEADLECDVYGTGQTWSQTRLFLLTHGIVKWVEICRFVYSANNYWEIKVNGSPYSTVAGGNGTARIEIAESGPDISWEVLIDGVSKAHNTIAGGMSYEWNQVLLAVGRYSTDAPGHSRNTRTAVTAVGSISQWGWDDSGELDDWDQYFTSPKPALSGSYITTKTGGDYTCYLIKRFTAQLAEPSCAVCQGYDGAYYAAVGEHSGSQADPTVSVYRCLGNGLAWELLACAATPAGLGGTEDLVAWPSGSGGPTVAARLGATIVQWMEQMPDGRLVIGLGRNSQRKVGTAAISPDTWWLTSENAGLTWAVHKLGLVGSGARISTFAYDPVGDLHCHLIETPIGQNVDQARHWYARGYAGTLLPISERALGDAGTPTSINPERVQGITESGPEGWLIANRGVNLYGGYAESQRRGVWADMVATALAYSQVLTGTLAAQGPPAFARQPMGRVDVIWRGYALSGTPVDATHLWHRTCRADEGYPGLIYDVAPPAHQVCALTADQIAWSPMRLIVGQDGALDLFVKVWEGGKLAWYRSEDGGVTWGLERELVW